VKESWVCAFHHLGGRRIPRSRPAGVTRGAPISKKKKKSKGKIKAFPEIEKNR
jgi:hypothetical protein